MTSTDMTSLVQWHPADQPPDGEVVLVAWAPDKGRICVDKGYFHWNLKKTNGFWVFACEPEKRLRVHRPKFWTAVPSPPGVGATEPVPVPRGTTT